MFLRIELNSRNSINSTIRYRLLLQVIHFRKCSIRSSDLLELLFYMKKSYRILQLQFQLHSSSNSTSAHYTTIQRILHPESNSTYRRQRALRILLLHYRGQRDLLPDSRKEILCIEGKEIF